MATLIRQNEARLLLELGTLGLPITEQQKQSVRNIGMGAELDRAEGKLPTKPEDGTFGEAHHWLFEIPKNKRGEPLEGTCYWDKIPKAWKEEYKDKEIKKEDWCPMDPREMDAKFRAFISSHIPRFDQLIIYKEFFLYLEQARQWLEDTRDYSDFKGQEQWDWVQQELARIKVNKLYGLNKYITIKEDGKQGGRRKYKASTPQALLAFLIDRGNSFDLVKGRQAAITSTMLAIASLQAVVRRSYKGVFVTHEVGGTGKTLFNDKFKSTLQHLPAWIAKDIHYANWSDDQVTLDFDPGDTKADKKKDDSNFILKGSKDTQTINGMTPSEIYFDETQNIPTYQKIKAEADPTMYQFDEEEGKFLMSRAIYAWGTGSSNTSGQGSFENDFRGLHESWNKGDDTEGWLPLFMDWTCRPGMTKEFYLMQKRKYLRGQTEETKGLTESERLSLFKAHYPSEPDDAFLAAHKHLIPVNMIVEQMNNIAHKYHSIGGATYGRFVPVFDESVKIPPGAYFEHPVIGVNWEPMGADADAPIKMFMPPDNTCANRYFQGTDPISNDGGQSRFASAIWDNMGPVSQDGERKLFHETVSCILNHRTPFPEDLFVQSILMGMYYRNYGQKACRELVEWNDGKKYVDMKEGPVFNLRQSLIVRMELPTLYKGGTHPYGIDLKNGSKNGRKTLLFHDICKLLREMGHRIWFYEFWSQVKNIVVEGKTDGSVEFGCKKGYNDDLVFAVAYAYLAAKTINKQPEMVNHDRPQMIKKTKLRRDMNTASPTYLQLREMEVMVPTRF